MASNPKLPLHEDNARRVVEALESVAGALTGTGHVEVPICTIRNETGATLDAQATTTSGFQQVSNGALQLNIPVNATIEAFLGQAPLPADVDETEDIEVHVVTSKSANNDTLTLDCEFYTANASTDHQDTAAQAVPQAETELVFTCGANAAFAGPGLASIVLAVGGTNDGDAINIHRVWIEYTRKPLI